MTLIVAIYCWIALFIKRFHDGGKSGWLCLVPGLVFVFGAWIISAVVPPMFAPELYNNMQTAMEDVLMSGGDFASVMSATMEISKEYGEPMAKKIALPQSVILAIWSLVVAFLSNALIKHDPKKNQYDNPSKTFE